MTFETEEKKNVGMIFIYVSLGVKRKYKSKSK